MDNQHSFGNESWDSAQLGGSAKNRNQPWGPETIVSGPRPGTLTLGQVIDGYIHLSDAEKRIFASACLGATQGSDAGLSRPTSSTDVPFGKTKDPKTGKVFSITPKREKNPIRLGLESDLAAAKRAYSEFLRGNNIQTGVNGVPRDVPQVLIPVGRDLYEDLDAAKSALAGYKSAHPEEFLPPPNKKKNLSSLEVMASIKPAPLGGSGPTGPEKGSLPSKEVKPPSPKRKGAAASPPRPVSKEAKTVVPSGSA